MLYNITETILGLRSHCSLVTLSGSSVSLNSKPRAQCASMRTGCGSRTDPWDPESPLLASSLFNVMTRGGRRVKRPMSLCLQPTWKCRGCELPGVHRSGRTCDDATPSAPDTWLCIQQQVSLCANLFCQLVQTNLLCLPSARTAVRLLRVSVLCV